MQTMTTGQAVPALDPAKEMRTLKKKFRRVERELEYRTQLLKKTDELYRTSERVLTQAHQDLEGLIERNNAMQIELNQVSRMAALGELSARMIHEVLNPMTAMMGRLSSAMQRLQPNEDEDAIGILHEILTDWQGSFEKRELSALVEASEAENCQDFLEDMEDVSTVLGVVQSERVDLLEDLHFMDRTSKHMVQIINGMRSLGHSQTEDRHEDLNTLCRSAVELSRDALKHCGVQIIERYDPTIPTIQVVGNEIIQILTNLLGNAQYAMPDGGTVQVETSIGAGRLELRIIDNGSGINLPLAEQDLIFEGGWTTKSKEEGTGLGLSICRRFARKAQGDIVVDWTHVGKGTSILVWLPIPEGEDNQNESMLGLDGANE